MNIGKPIGNVIYTNKKRVQDLNNILYNELCQSEWP